MAAAPQTPFLTFLTTAFRTEDYLPDTIESVLAQDHPDWELVVVDNGNDDAIAAIVTSYAERDARVRLVRQDNQGYVGGLTAAADVARGTVLVPLDSDDQVMPGFVRRVADFLADHPDADAVGCDAHLFTDEHDRPHGRGYLRSVGIRMPAREGDRLSLEDVLSGRVPYYGAAIRRTAWDAVGGYRAAADDVDESVDIWLRLAQDYTIYMLPDRLARYRVRTDSLSRHPQSVEKFEVALVNTFLNHAERSEASRGAGAGAAADSTVRKLRYHQALRRGRWALEAGDVEEARTQARAAYGQRRTLRVGLILVLLRLVPGLLMRVHPVKQQVERWVSDHTPQRGWRPASVSRGRSGRAARRAAPAEGQPGRPPTSS